MSVPGRANRVKGATHGPSEGTKEERCREEAGRGRWEWAVPS